MCAVLRIDSTRRLRVFVLCAAASAVILLSADVGIGATAASSSDTQYDEYDDRPSHGHPNHQTDGGGGNDDDVHRESLESANQDAAAPADAYSGSDDDGDHNDEHEMPPERVAVKVRLRGDLATPAPDSGIELGFVPKQTYYQVRRYDTRVHLPRSAAIDEAETAEELANAPRLREVVSHTKTQQVYEEQGYEDAAYDHAGYKKAGQRHESTRVHVPATAAAAKYTADDANNNEDEDDQVGSSGSRRVQIDDRSLELAPSDNHTDEPVSESRNNDFASDDDNDAFKSRQKTKGAESAAVSDEPLPRKRTKLRAAAATTATRSRQKSTKNNVKLEKDGSKSSQDGPATSSSAPYVKRRRKTKNNSTTTTTVTVTRGNDDNDGHGHSGGGTKLAQESKTISSKLKVKDAREQQQQDQEQEQSSPPPPPRHHNNRQLVTPTTYRPSTLPETLTRLRTAAIKRKPAFGKSSTRNEQRAAAAAAASATPVMGSFAKNMLIDSSGYVFENPFSDVQNSHELETLVKPLATLRSKSKMNDGGGGGGIGIGEYAVTERPNENHQTSRPYEKSRPRKPPTTAAATGVATASSAKSKLSRPKANSQSFPYEIVDVRANANGNANNAPRKWRTEATPSSDTAAYKIKTKFPYEIVTSSANWSPPAAPLTSGSATSARKRFKSYSPSSRNETAAAAATSSSYALEDDSPWIPITPKEAYDIHGYAAAASARRENATVPQVISVTEWPVDNFTSQRPRDVLAKRRRKMDPIRVYEHLASSKPSSSSTLAPIAKRSRLQNSVVSTSYSIRHEYDSPTNVNAIDSGGGGGGADGNLFSIAFPDSWLDRPARRHRFNGVAKSKPTPASASGHSYLPPQIDQSFDSQQKLFNDAMDKEESRRRRLQHHQQHSNDIETLSSNRYSVFQRFEHTTLPMGNSATYSDNGDRLLQYRHPYLPRETSHLQQVTSSTQQQQQQHQHQHRDQQEPSSLPPQLSTQQQQNFTSNKNEIFDGGGGAEIGNNKEDVVVGGGVNATSPTTAAGRNLTRYRPNDYSIATSASASVESKPSPQRLDKIIVYPVDYASSASFVENLTLAHYADPVNTVRASLPLNYRDRLHALRHHFVENKTSDNEDGGSVSSGHTASPPPRKIRSASNQQLLGVYMDGSTTEITVDVDKYPFYKYKSGGGSSGGGVGANSLAKYSVLRYVSNPKTIPTKKAGQMSFYQSTNNVRCPEPEAPSEVAPPRQRDGQWAGESAAKGKPRVRNVGNSIRCHKIKFFGYDPLDNPFFQEESVGYPEVVRETDVDDDDDDDAGKKKRRRSKSANSGGARRHNRYRKSPLTKRAAKFGGTRDDAAAAKKMVRKAVLVGGFINIGPNNDDVVDDDAATVATNLGNENSNASIFPLVRVVDEWSTPKTAAAELATNANTNTTVAGKVDAPTTVINNGHGSAMAYDRIGVTSGDFAAVASSWSPPPFKPEYKEPSWRNANGSSSSSSNRSHLYDQHAIGGADASEGKPSASGGNRRHLPTRGVGSGSDVDVGVGANGGVDSLLYVIHPESGRGKWMKIVKVERLADQFNSSAVVDERREPETTSTPTPADVAAKAKAKGVGHHRFASNNKHTLHRDGCNDNVDVDADADASTDEVYGDDDNQLAYDFERRRQRQRQRSSLETTQRKRLNEKPTITLQGKRAATATHEAATDGMAAVGVPQYDADIRRISGLLRQVAPLKASQAEINNLQTNRERSEDDAAVDADVSIDDVDHDHDDDDNDDSNKTNGVVPMTMAKAKATQIQTGYENRNRDGVGVGVGDKAATVQFPQPHERLYYYVVDE